MAGEEGRASWLGKKVGPGGWGRRLGLVAGEEGRASWLGKKVGPGGWGRR